MVTSGPAFAETVLFKRTVAVKEPVHPFTLTIETVYVPGASPLNVLETWLVVPPSIEYWKGPVPEEGLIIMPPSFPAHEAGVVVTVAVIPAPELTTAVPLPVSPNASSTKTVYVPAASPVNVLEACCAPPLIE
jgi:hypothetical protein